MLYMRVYKRVSRKAFFSGGGCHRKKLTLDDRDKHYRKIFFFKNDSYVKE